MPQGYRNDGTKLGFQKGNKNPKFGKRFTQKERKEMSEMIKELNFNTGKKCRFWKGGKRITNGYLEIYYPTHPFCNNKKYVRKHRLVMEKHLERLLKPEEIVHHINGQIRDNRFKNLMLFASNSEHSKFHRNKEKLCV